MYEGGKKFPRADHQKAVWEDHRGGHEYGLWIFQVHLEFPGACEMTKEEE